MDGTGSLVSSLVRKLEARDRLSDAEKQALAEVIAETHIVAAGQDIVKDGDRPGRSNLLVEGFASRNRILQGGGRQITEVHVRGDFVDLHSFLLKQMDHAVTALSLCRVATVPHAELVRVTEQHPHLTRLLWLTTLLDAAIHREWLAAMGRMTALSRAAHLVCELYVRLSVVNATNAQSFELPVTQSELADMLGLSTVHANRVLQELRSRSVLTWKGTVVTILDWEGLTEIGEFDDRYLHQRREPR